VTPATVEIRVSPIRASERRDSEHGAPGGTLSFTTNQRSILMKQNSITTIASLSSLVSGLKKNQPKGVFAIDGARYTAAQLVSIFQTILAALQAVPAAKGTYQKAVRSSDALQAQYHAVTVQLKQSLQMQAGADTELLADYGLTPRKRPGVRSPKVNVAAADKAVATRAARHTLGPKKKLQITGATVAAAQALASAGTPIVAAPPSATPVVTPGH
jgi:hypothetical protein